jgi:RNA polymerase sigma factor (sigma-70 family)
MAGGRPSLSTRQIRCLWAGGTAAGLSDGQLLERFISGRGEVAEIAFAAVVARHGPAVLGACRRALADPNDADDAFQATFLILVRKAGSLRVGESLGPWLLGVARRVASRARAEAARRRSREGPGAEPTAGSADGPGRLELRTVIDEELGRLPARHREAVMLCHLEGLTYEEAAARLGCPSGTVKSRLARARERLRDRLTRRGLAPSCWVAVGTLATPPVPPGLAEATIAAATSGAVPVHAAILAKAVFKEMFMFRLKWTAALALAMGLLAAGARAQQESGDSFLKAMSGMAARPEPARGDGERDAEVAILRLEREWRDAIVRRDLAACERFMADDYVVVDTGGGVRDKAAALEQLRKGDVSARSYEAIETKVRVYGDTAVVNGLSRWDSEDIRITSVYARRHGTWRCVAWQGMVVGR